MKLLSGQLWYTIIRNIFTMMGLQRMPKDVMEHKYCVTEHMSMKICRVLPLFVKNMFYKCSITEDPFMQYFNITIWIHFAPFYCWYSYSLERVIAVGWTMRSNRLEENVKILINQLFDIRLYKSPEYTVI